MACETHVKICSHSESKAEGTFGTNYFIAAPRTLGKLHEINGGDQLPEQMSALSFTKLSCPLSLEFIS